MGRSRPWPVGLLLLAAALCAPDGGSAAPAGEIEGSWRVVSVQRDGRPDPSYLALTKRVEDEAEILPWTYASVTGRDLALSWGEPGRNFTGSGDYPMRVTTGRGDPKAIDVRVARKAVTGIDKLEGKRLTVCLARPGEPRPTRFGAEAGAGQTVVVFERGYPPVE